MNQSPSDKDRKIVVLGAGSTGLGVSLGLTLFGSDYQATVIEKSHKVGGLAGSFRWRGHIVDLGPHRLSPNIEIVRIVAEEILGPDCLVQKSQHGIQMFGRLYQFPPRVIDWINPLSIYVGVRLSLSFVAQKFIWIVRRFNADTFESLMVRKFGKYFYQKIAEPMTEKVWIHPKHIDPNFVNLRFAHITPREVVKKLIFPSQELNPSIFYYPRLGYQQLWDEISYHVRGHGIRIANNAKPLSVEVKERKITKVVVQTESGQETFEGDGLHVVSTIPLVHFLDVLQGDLDVEKLKDHAKDIKFRSMLLVCFEFSIPRALPFRTLIFPQRDVGFNRLFEQNEYSRDTVEAGKSVVVADITLPRGDARMRQSDDEIIANVRNDLAKLNYVPVDKISAACVERVEFAYVVPDVAGRRAMHTINHTLSQISNLDLMGRFSVGEYDNSDYAIDNGVALGGVLSGRVTRKDYLINIHKKKGRSIVG